jgi:hypothetical protein
MFYTHADLLTWEVGADIAERSLKASSCQIHWSHRTLPADVRRLHTASLRGSGVH